MGSQILEPASTNFTMPWNLVAHPDLDFHPENQLFGCISHVLDLAACSVLLVFGVVHEPE